jgi:hypothetical protein
VLVNNVGGDYRQPHRPDDPNDRVFLDGNLMKASTIDARLTWEFVHQMWFEAWYLDELIRDVTSGFEDRNHTWGLRIRTEF